MMKLLSFVLLVVAAVAEPYPPYHQPSCPSNPAGRPIKEKVLPYYKYSFEMSKSGDAGSIYIPIDSDERANQIFWFRVTADASTANTASINVRLNVSSDFASDASYNDNFDPAWCGCDMSPDGEYYQRRNLTAAGFNVAAGRYITITFYPSCSTCRSTVEFSVEAAWILNDIDTPEDLVFPPIPIENNLRTMVFERNNGQQLDFYSDLTMGDWLLSSIVYDSRFDDDTQTSLYWRKDMPATATLHDDLYPSDGVPPSGNYLQPRTFNATSTGTWYVSPLVVAGTSSASITLKFGINEIPCSMGSTLSVSSFVFALVALLFFQLN